MHLSEIHITNFRNYTELNLEFPAQVNFLVGLNGSGKTNLLDAIYYLSATKSFLNGSDSQNIRYGSDFFSIRGKFILREKKHEIFCQVQAERKKIFREDHSDYTRLSDHIGKYPMVVISPVDVDLVKESSEARRRFFDQMIAQIDHNYLEALMVYQHALKQRNALLQLFAERNYADEDMLESYNDQLVQAGTRIHQRRKEFVEEFQPVFEQAYNGLVESNETISLNYKSQLSELDFHYGLTQNRNKDRVLQRTTFGIHRDDYHFGFAHGDLKRLGSQGQQKSFLVAVKLAQVEVIKVHDGFCPILLLDDIFDKLDDHRISRLLETVTGPAFGQLFITDAGPERTRALKDQLQIDGQVFTVDRGIIVPS
jgi:DNA replication and repair protein RecF